MTIERAGKLSVKVIVIILNPSHLYRCHVDNLEFNYWCLRY